jgi:K+/H+ antiporter YhaU regulatory subunit KhtT
MGEMIESKVVEKYGKHIICLVLKGDKNDCYKRVSIQWEDCKEIGDVLETLVKHTEGEGTHDSLVNEIIKEAKLEKEATESAYG